MMGMAASEEKAAASYSFSSENRYLMWVYGL